MDTLLFTTIAILVILIILNFREMKKELESVQKKK